MITYQEEKFVDVYDEALPILYAHYEEIAWRKDKIELDIDYDRYVALAEAGYVDVVTARDDGVLIGYCVTIADTNMHYKSNVFARNDILYIKPEYRNARVGCALIQFVEERLRKFGVQVHIIHMKTYAPFDGLMLGLGYEAIEKNYSKILE